MERVATFYTEAEAMNYCEKSQKKLKRLESYLIERDLFSGSFHVFKMD